MLRRLTAAGIEIHTQVVLCPGINDGAELTRTIEDLYSLYPGVQSLAVVPVGLTGYRQRLPELRPLSAAEAATVIAQVHDFQQRFLEKSGSRFVFAADELYLQAGIGFPPLEAYEELPQMENGVGMVAVFRREAVDVLAEAEPLAIPPVAVVTGMSALAEVNRFAADLAAKTGARIIVHPIRSDFFGGHVSVTGLLAGKDILAQLRGKDLGKMLLIPDVMLKEGEEVFLDDLSLDDLERELKIPVRRTGSTPWGFLESLEELAAEGPQGD
jgi:putative radical SAM enzyme (TIGR03279 family)